MTDGTYPNGPRDQNGRRDQNKLLLSILGAAWAVILLSGGGWVASIQSQANSNAFNTSSLTVLVTRLETRMEERLNFYSRENADLRIKVQELERTLSSLGARGGGSR